ncbi:hypothetical protein KIN20_023336, partial [Parelaphostrongylus tenuis]
YWSVYGAGPSGETPAYFTEFRPFAGWTTPTVKQFGQAEFVCNVKVNRNVYVANTTSMNSVKMEKFKNTQEISVGGLGLKNTAFTGKPEIKLLAST